MCRVETWTCFYMFLSGHHILFISRNTAATAEVRTVSWAWSLPRPAFYWCTPGNMSASKMFKVTSFRRTSISMSIIYSFWIKYIYIYIHTYTYTYKYIYNIHGIKKFCSAPGCLKPPRKSSLYRTRSQGSNHQHFSQNHRLERRQPSTKLRSSSEVSALTHSTA